MNEGYLIREEDALACPKSQVRQEIVDALAAAGPVTVAELGRLLERALDSLYPQVDR